MKITNKLNLPQYLYDWVVTDDYDYNHDEFTISATSLMKPVRSSVLINRYGDQLETDVVDLIASRLGSSIHDSIERIKTEHVKKEQRLTRQIILDDGTVYIVSGKFDVLVDELQGKKRLRDIKTTSVWAFIYGGKDEEYRKQLSIYRWLLSPTENVEEVAYIDFIFTDWQSVKAKQDKEYPQQRIQPGYKIELMTLEQTEIYIKERLTLYHKNKNVDDKELPTCTPDELWQTMDTYAVMKSDAKRATKICNSKQEAEIYIRDKDIKKSFIEFRQGKVKRCKYCAGLPFCNQGQYYLTKNLIDF